jgi:hypothetical protein
MIDTLCTMTDSDDDERGAYRSVSPNVSGSGNKLANEGATALSSGLEALANLVSIDIR